MRTRVLATLILSPTLALGLGGVRCEEEPPRDLGLVETAERRLVQVDVTVLGPASRVSALTAEDFQVVVAGREIDGITVDRLCAAGEAAKTALDAGSLTTVDPAPASRLPRRELPVLF